MSTWRTLTTGDLNDAKAAPLINAVRTTCLASGQADPTTNLIANVAEEIRGAIGFSGKYLISATDAALPPNLLDMAAQKVVRVCKRRLEQMLTPDERDEEQVYQKRLGLLREGRYQVDAPDDPVTSNPSTPSGRVTGWTFNADSDPNTARPYSRSETRYL